MSLLSFNPIMGSDFSIGKKTKLLTSVVEFYKGLSSAIISN